MSSKKITILIIFLIFSFNIQSNQVNKILYASWDKPDVEILYTLPKEINNQTKVLFIIHGNSRDVKKYLNLWLEDAKDKNVILVAPHFTKENYPNFGTLQIAKSSGKILNDQSNNLTNSISSFFTYFKSKYNLESSTYRIFGFSAGSQFVHRYLMYGKDTRTEKAVLGSAGWYTFLNEEKYPYGTKNMPIEKERYEWFLSRRVLFILGNKDNDPNHPTLNLSKGAKKQGNNRYERGQNYFDNLLNFSQKNKIPFRWRYKVVPSLDHNTEMLSKNAIPFLLEDLSYN
ncbi:MAG: hypothetical protein ACJ0FM_05980 [Gammaproteobacteria bacterium]|tara:strand:- start:1038 stop:1895 length:858 start_codon:yes stop_codon:yes gene_type:complete